MNRKAFNGSEVSRRWSYNFRFGLMMPSKRAAKTINRQRVEEIALPASSFDYRKLFSLCKVTAAHLSLFTSNPVRRNKFHSKKFEKQLNLFRDAILLLSSSPSTVFLQQFNCVNYTAVQAWNKK